MMPPGGLQLYQYLDVSNIRPILDSELQNYNVINVLF